MRRELRKQPWQTFPFWFLILSGVALLGAWHLDLLKPAAKPVAEEQSTSEEEQAPDWANEEAASEEMAAVEEQLEPVVDEAEARSFPADEVKVASNDAVNAAQSAESEPPAAAPPSEPNSRSTPAGNPFSSHQIRITPVSGSRTISSTKKDPIGISSEKANNPFGPTSTEIRGVRTQTSSEDQTGPAGPKQPAADANAQDNPDSSKPESEEKSSAPAAMPAEGNSKSPEQGEENSEKSAKPVSKVDFTKIDQLIEDGEDVEANFQLSNLYWKQPEVRPQLLQRLRAVAYRIYFAPQPHYMDGHVVQAGEALQNIAKANNVSWEYLAKLNRTEPKKIRPGQKLKLIRGPFSAVVDISDHELTVHSHGHFVAVFPVGIGRDHASPAGTFKVMNKQRDPTYYGAEGVIEHNDAKNPLGEYLLDLGEGIAIHGTNDVSGIGKTGGPGCVSLKDRDAADVYDLLTVGSEVIIKR